MPENQDNYDNIDIESFIDPIKNNKNNTIVRTTDNHNKESFDERNQILNDRIFSK